MRAFLKKHGFILAASLASSAVVLAVHLRILTYVTAQDPFIYIRLARKLVAASFSPAEILEVFRWMMPGYPLLLAAAIRLGGPFAPYWVNLPFTIGLFVLIALLARRLYADGLPLVVMTLLGVWLILGGHGLNPHFLLYPFRESPMLFFCFLGFWLVLLAREKEKAAWYALAGISFLLAGGIREPALFCVPFVAFAVARGCPRGQRAKRVGWFLLPFLPAVGLWIGLSVLKGGWGTAQMSFWAYRLPEGGPIEKIQHALRTLLPMMALLPRAMGWGGVGLLVLGWLHAIRRRRDALFFFALPGLSLLLFYGCYETHARRFMEALVLLCPLALGGLYLLLSGAAALAERLLRRRISAMLFNAALLLIAVFVSMSAARVRPWGLRISREDVRRFQAQMRPYEGTNSLVFMDVRCRYLTDALLSYTRVITADPLWSGKFREDSRRLGYADPANPSCYVASGREYQGVSPESVLRHYFDVETPAGHESRIQLGPNRFVMKDVLPWTSTNAIHPLPPNSTGNRIVWLDFQSATQCAKRVTLMDAARQPVRSWAIEPAVGLQPVYLEPGPTGSFLRVESEGVMPDRVIQGIQEAARPFMSDLTQTRPLSLVKWFKPPFLTAGARHKNGVTLAAGGVLEIPAIPGAEKLTLTIQLAFQPNRRQKSAIRLIYEEEGREIARGAVDLGRSLIRHRIQLPPRVEGGLRRVVITADPPLPEGSFLKVTGFGIALE